MRHFASTLVYFSLLTCCCEYFCRNVYRKWNERLFRELYTAYKHGRAEKDPSEFWYQGEIGIFDFYMYVLI